MEHQNRMSSQTWMPDNEMGHGYDMMIFDGGEDYSGRVNCTVIRKPSDTPSTKGVLYIHGFSDYFFQAEMATQFTRHGYHFYAVDLRKYGRSLRPGQRPFEVRDLREYFDDIRAGIAAMEQDSIKDITLMGHSTGGLTCALFMQTEPHERITSLILNSPFLTWNVPGLKGKIGVPAMSAAGKVLPTLTVKSDGNTDYAKSLHKDFGGEWTYRRDWKPDTLPDVDAAWVRAIDIAQKSLVNGQIKVPILLLHSDKSAYHGDPEESFKVSDAILDATAISEAGKKLGTNVTDFTVYNGMHDVTLSRPDVRAVVFTEIFTWLDSLKASE
ncbi:MAG: alpha/beta hydrolase [Firmicutes bacterium]|nr:alpha/beta hydrolase [Bacillota bacterium]MCM1401675.1 alpha/beta hydrolase [Bacteroides sp.]MCM1477548.1 alpha/beta hydrolase [Bacteroides sp.]